MEDDFTATITISGKTNLEVEAIIALYEALALRTEPAEVAITKVVVSAIIF